MFGLDRLLEVGVEGKQVVLLGFEYDYDGTVLAWMAMSRESGSHPAVSTWRPKFFAMIADDLMFEFLSADIGRAHFHWG